MATQDPSYPLFAGRVRHSLDAKNRTVIPANWRTRDPAPLWLVPQTDHACLLAMPFDEFNAIPARVNARTDLNPKARQNFIDWLFAEAQEVIPDKQGRFVIPEHFCAELELRNEVVLAGASAKFKIWNVASFDKFHAEQRQNTRAIGEEVQL